MSAFYALKLPLPSYPDTFLQPKMCKKGSCSRDHLKAHLTEKDLCTLDLKQIFICHKMFQQNTVETTAARKEAYNAQVIQILPTATGACFPKGQAS